MYERVWIAILIVLATVAALVVGWIWHTRRYTNYTLGQSFWYLVNRLFTRLLWRTRVTGRLPPPGAGGAVIVSNHRSGIDPLLIQVASDRIVHWMVASEYWTSVMGLVFRTLRAIPVGRRGVDTAATKQAIRLAKEGGLVGLFPEGRINVSSEVLLPGRPGAALIALRARVPVIPIYITGSPYDGSALGPFRMSAKVHVAIGAPINLSEYAGRPQNREVLAQLTLRFMKEIARLAGDQQFEPQLAGKNWRYDEETAPEPDGGDEPAESANPEIADLPDSQRT